MILVKDLNLGFSDAQNYTQRGNKQMLSEVFVKNEYLDELLKPYKYYLIGEKGTGKTAYAAYLSNFETDKQKSCLKFISGTDYEKFYELKKWHHLDISGYVDIWKTILLLLLAKDIRDSDKIVSAFDKNKLPQLIKAIDEYYNNAFSPEITTALKITDKSECAAKLVSKFVEAGADKSSTAEFSETRFQMNLYYISKKFEDCLGELKLKKDITLFIDGIDVRPTQIPYEEYLQCIKGLANACWTLNSNIFSNTRDTKGHLKIVLLLRPDIFSSLNLQNATNKLADNSVYLDWRTTYNDYQSSNLYKMAQKLLQYSQSEKTIPNIWEYYFDWRLKPSAETRDYDTAFMEFLKISLCRPRDIQYILSLIQKIMKERGCNLDDKFSLKIYQSDRFQNDYSEYFLSSLRDQLSFYYSENDFKHFRKFFDFFSEAQFTYNEYKEKYEIFVEYILNNAKEIPPFVEDPNQFLQLLYDCNIITAIEKTGRNVYFHFSYREKSLTNIAPEVLYDKSMEYRFHYGLYKKTKLGRYD